MRLTVPLAVLALAASSSANPFAAAAVGMLDNGLRVILLPDPSLPVVSSTVLVGAGSEREDESTSGATHLLEHLLFNGTRSMTQEQLYETADLHGIYLNAATRERGTILIGLSPPDELETLLRLQAEMLFFSTIPPVKFEKEKLIVLEEIARDRTQPDDALWLRRAHMLYAPSPCRFPILGSPATVGAMDRQTVLDYYRSHYVPNNMTLMLIGSFAWPAAWNTLHATFGEAPPAPVSPSRPCPFAPPAAPDTVWGSSQTPSVTFAFAGPGSNEGSFPSFFLASRVLPEVLTSLRDPAASSWDASLHVGPRESRLLVSANVVAADSCGAIAARARGLMAQALAIDDAALGRAAGVWRHEATRWLERPHMVGVVAYDLLTAIGWDGLVSLWDRLARINAATWHLDVGPCLSAPHATRVELVREGPPSYEGLDPVPAQAKPTPQRGPTTRPVYVERVPALDPDSLQGAAPRRDVADTLDSGLVISVRSEPGSDLAGMHVLFRHRGTLEPPGFEGVAELFHRVVGSGPDSMPEAAFAHRLDGLGALLQVTDDPFLPFDDYFYSPRWGYLRLTVPAESLQAAATLLVASISRPRADSTVLYRERSTALAALAREARSPGRTAARRFWERALPGDPRVRSPLGTTQGLMRVRHEDIVSFSRAYLVGGNMIVTVCTPSDGRATVDMLRQVFKAMPAGEIPRYSAPVPSPEKLHLEDSLGVGQGSLLMVGVAPVSDEERPAFELLGAVLDRRMGLVLRERYGLAYSLGAQVAFEDSIAFLFASVGTRTERLKEAEERLRELLLDLPSSAGADSVERRAAAMSLEQRARLRNLTRVGRAFSMGMDLMRGRAPASVTALETTRAVKEEALASLLSRLLIDYAVVVIR